MTSTPASLGSASLDRIGVGIDTARYGHRVSFLKPDRQPAAKPLTVLENHAGYQALHDRLSRLHSQHPLARFHIHIDAAGQYAANLEHFLRGLDLPITLSIGEPKRNKDYQKAHFPKRTTDDTESQAMARFGVVETPPASIAISPAMIVLREVASRLQAKVKQTTQAVNRLHNLLARVFPELAALADDFSACWVLDLLDKYPTAVRIAQARTASLEGIPYIPSDKVHDLHNAAAQSVGSLRGNVVETLVRDLVTQVRQCQKAQKNTSILLKDAFDQLPTSGHLQIVTIPGVGDATAAVLVAKILDIQRFPSPNALCGYFGIFPNQEESGVDKHGNPLPTGTRSMSHKGNDLVRSYLWNAARSGIRHNPALRALYHRLKSRGKRGDVAIGHCMRKLLHLVFALWKTNRPFDDQHFPWDTPSDNQVSNAAKEITVPGNNAPATPASTSSSPTSPSAIPENEKAVGHKADISAEQVVTTASLSVDDAQAGVNPSPTLTPTPTAGPVAEPARPARPRVDFAFLRKQVCMEQVLRHLGLFDRLHGKGQQRRGPCPLHPQAGQAERTFSVHLGKNIFKCFQSDCAMHGNALDLWAAIHRLPLYEAALLLADTFHVPRNREEEHV